MKKLWHENYTLSNSGLQSKGGIVLIYFLFDHNRLLDQPNLDEWSMIL